MRCSASRSAQLVEQQVDDALDLREAERVEQDDVVDAVEELGPEVAVELAHHQRPGLGLDLAGRGGVLRAGTATRCWRS